ncbi:N-acetylglucosamine-6-phosphate deacetylase [Labedella phragmitis]|uniref:N-acetylglucosamine-6-phosphate deacetylase n=1 Tax=Labedella phragmitis TaxID=2498849 RepID=UPI0014086794|nr:N-acetylglucosamine-6-phosphate deacetylase [Labedella phragmitis]
MTRADLRVSRGRTLLPDGSFAAKDVVVVDGRIAALEAPAREPNGSAEVDARGLLVVPGFVDTHVHGALGRNFMEGSTDAATVIGGFLVRHGVTSVVAATASLPSPVFEESIAPLRSLVGRGPTGLDVLGVHLEGPFLNPRRRGVHRADAVRDPDIAELRRLVTVLGDSLTIVTLAPETPHGLDAVRTLVRAEVSVSIGHSDADGAATRAAVAAGATRATHLFNAMPERRGDSLVSAVLADPRVRVEIIVDGRHVPPEVVAAVYREVGAERVVVVSDGSDGTGLPDGHHRRWEGTDVVISDGTSSTPEGTLAGSITPLDAALRVLVDRAGVPLADALRSLSSTPAASIGARHKGSIRVGADADLVLLDDTLAVVATIAGGRLVHRRPGPRGATPVST